MDEATGSAVDALVNARAFVVNERSSHGTDSAAFVPFTECPVFHTNL